MATYANRKEHAMKKILSTIVIIVLITMLAGCDDEDIIGKIFKVGKDYWQIVVSPVKGEKGPGPIIRMLVQSPRNNHPDLIINAEPEVTLGNLSPTKLSVWSGQLLDGGGNPVEIQANGTIFVPIKSNGGEEVMYAARGKDLPDGWNVMIYKSSQWVYNFLHADPDNAGNVYFVIKLQGDEAVLTGEIVRFICKGGPSREVEQINGAISWLMFESREVSKVFAAEYIEASVWQQDILLKIPDGQEIGEAEIEYQSGNETSVLHAEIPTDDSFGNSIFPLGIVSANPPLTAELPLGTLTGKNLGAIRVEPPEEPGEFSAAPALSLSRTADRIIPVYARKYIEPLVRRRNGKMIFSPAPGETVTAPDDNMDIQKFLENQSEETLTPQDKLATKWGKIKSPR